MAMGDPNIPGALTQDSPGRPAATGLVRDFALIRVRREVRGRFCLATELLKIQAGTHSAGGWSVVEEVGDFAPPAEVTPTTA